MMIFAACEESTDPDGSSTAASSSETESGTSADTTQNGASDSETVGGKDESATEKVIEDHEIRDYFVFDDYKVTDDDIYTTVSRIDGDIIDYDYYHNMVVVRNKDFDGLNVVESVKVYDLTTMEVINEQSVKNEMGIDESKTVELDVSLNYPIIRVEKKSYGEGGDNAEYDISYYFAKKGSDVIRRTSKENFELNYFDNGLVAVDMGDDVVWIDVNMEIVRTVSSVAANGYDIDEFDCEYKGYLYAWDRFDGLQIFNRSGVCCGVYRLEHNGEINVRVLNNGNALIQDLEYVDEYTTCDFVLGGHRCKVQSYIMNFIDGSLTPVEIDFIVDRTETAYESKNSIYRLYDESMPFEMADGHDNQAFIFRFANGTIARYPEYVVMTDELEIEYSIKNNTEGVNMYNAYVADANHYCAYVEIAGNQQLCLFDLDGNMLLTVNDYTWINGNRIVSRGGVYDMDMNIVYDFEKNGYVYNGSIGDDLILRKMNYKTGAYETYRFDVATLTAKPFTDGVKKDLVINGFDCYLVVDTETYVYTLYNVKDEELLVTKNYSSIDYTYDYYLIVTEFEGKPVTYVIGK